MENEIMKMVSEIFKILDKKLDEKLDEKLAPLLNTIENIEKIHAEYDRIFKMIEDKPVLNVENENVSDEIKKITNEMASIRVNITEIGEAINLVEHLTVRTAEDIERLRYLK